MKRLIQLVVLLSIVVITASADGPGGSPEGDGSASTMSGSSGSR